MSEKLSLWYFSLVFFLYHYLFVLSGTAAKVKSQASENSFWGKNFNVHYIIVLKVTGFTWQ